ncbi:hypothetical protein BOX15_Mlig005970g2 [Macrostomum lignano]|uniref:Insulin-like domain-containing protein n=1 Tax=Macrostomum lignano TaxID=282301 RepID=A0A267F414_9PLAT|nr:hypothetical protein BOX15_Mlig005970g2 [Macrostomum lignano]
MPLLLMPLLLLPLLLLPMASASSKMTLEEANRLNEYAHKRIRSCNLRRLLSTIMVLCKEVGLYNSSNAACKKASGEAPSKRDVDFSKLQVLPDDRQTGGGSLPWSTMHPDESAVLDACCYRHCNYCMLQRYCCTAPTWAKKFCYYTMPYDAK